MRAAHRQNASAFSGFVAGLCVVGIGLTAQALEPPPADVVERGVVVGFDKAHAGASDRAMTGQVLYPQETLRSSIESESLQRADVRGSSSTDSRANAAISATRKPVGLKRPRCGTLGPLASTAQAERLARIVARDALVIQQRRDRRTEAHRFLVVTAPHKAPEAARRLAAKLRESGINDFWTIHRGRLEGRISLGLYKIEENAIERAASLRALGFETQIRPQSREATAYWLDLELPRDAAGEASISGQLEALAPEVALSPVACTELARVEGNSE